MRHTGFMIGSILAFGSLTVSRPCAAQTLWGNYGGNAQHTALSTVASQPLEQVHWQTPVDLDPQFSGNDLLAHYGSPLMGGANTVLVPVKTGATDGFRVEAFNGADGSLLYQIDSDYTLPAHSWTPSYSPTLTSGGRLYLAGAGGTVYYRDDVSAPGAVTPGQIAFFGNSAYSANPSAFNSSIQICSPLTSDALGDVYFAYRADGSNPLGLQSGLARIDPTGAATYTSMTALTGGLAPQTLLNCAPALSSDGQTVYIAASAGTGFSSGYLVALDANTLQPKSQARLLDPQSGANAILADDGSASPMIAPDGHVYFGVLESSLATSKGWMLQFNADLSLLGTPGAFGWDDTASLVPASIVPSYHGASAYLLMTKYNNYAGLGGDGVNRLAILDPNDTEVDARSGATVMKEVLTIAGTTPDLEYLSAHPNAVREWCINTAVVDPFSSSVLANSEDGVLYRWDLATNTFIQKITLTPGLGEAYTPTVIGADGTVYAINNATLFAIGSSAGPEPASLLLACAGALCLGLPRRRVLPRMTRRR
jgi:hypothetical protein